MQIFHNTLFGFTNSRKGCVLKKLFFAGFGWIFLGVYGFSAMRYTVVLFLLSFPPDNEQIALFCKFGFVCQRNANCKCVALTILIY